MPYCTSGYQIMIVVIIDMVLQLSTSCISRIIGHYYLYSTIWWMGEKFKSSIAHHLFPSCLSPTPSWIRYVYEYLSGSVKG